MSANLPAKIMETRQRNILRAIIEEYSETAEPVGSHTLFEKYYLEIKPATIRLEMIDLTLQNYLAKPHISAGRVPTDKAYQFFVNDLMNEKELSKKEKVIIDGNLKEIGEDAEKLDKKIAETIALMSQSVGINKNDDDFYEAGLNWLVREPEFANRDNFIDLIDSLRDMERFFDCDNSGTKVFIGEDNLGKKLKNCGLIVKVFESESGAPRYLGILGPKRMDYARNISLLDYMAEILE